LEESWRSGAKRGAVGIKNPPKQEDWILLLLFAGGRRQRYNEPIAGKIRLMKELFLFLMRFRDVKGFYTFRAYKYGPYSDEAWTNLSELIKRGLVQTASGFGSEVYSLTPAGLERAIAAYDLLEPRLRQGLVDTKIQYNMMPLHELLTFVYERYPTFASKSEYEGPPTE
jgi:hypothetical protein